eukprot:6182511-Prymnesium_polylepis.2
MRTRARPKPALAGVFDVHFRPAGPALCCVASTRVCPGLAARPVGGSHAYSQSTDFAHISHHVTTTLLTHSDDSDPAGTPPLLTPSRWNHALTALLLPGHARAPECERAMHRFCPDVR